MEQTSGPPDWRIDNAKRLHGERFIRQNYHRKSPSWEHDHCEACWDKFMEDGPDGTLSEGYVTAKGDHWICPTCFEELRVLLDWRIESST